MSLGKIEAYLYASGTVGQFDTTAFTVTESVGPVSATVRLAAPARWPDALVEWAAALNASALNNTYALTWDATAQAVTIARTAGVSDFTVTPTAPVYLSLGFATAATTAAAATHTGTVQSRARYDSLRVGVAPVRDGGSVDITTYRLGRAEVLAFGNHDLHEVVLSLTAAQAVTFLESYCIAGRVRLWQDAALAAVWSYDYPQGYIDGYIVGVSLVETVGSSEYATRVRMAIAVPR